VLGPGDRAPSFALDGVSDPWSDGTTVLVFFKVTCPVCQLAAPKVQALADGGATVVAIGEDPPEKLETYAAKYGQRVPTVSEPAPYAVSDASGLDAVPAGLLVGADGELADAVAGWDRDGWNRVAAAAGVSPVSDAGDGLPAFRPG